MTTSTSATATANAKVEIMELPCVELRHKFTTDLPGKELSDAFLSLKKIVNLETYSTLTIGGQIIEELTYNSPILFIGHFYAAIACPELGQQDLALEELKSDPEQYQQLIRKAIGALGAKTKVKVRDPQKQRALKKPTPATAAAQDKLEHFLQAVSKCGNPLVALTVYTNQGRPYSKPAATAYSKGLSNNYGHEKSKLRSEDTEGPTLSSETAEWMLETIPRGKDQTAHGILVAAHASFLIVAMKHQLPGLGDVMAQIMSSTDKPVIYKRDRRGGWDNEQVETTIFCGGGSLIPYVFDELSKFCREHGVRSMRAKDPESTVCRGAVIGQLKENFFGLRLSRASFGIEVKKNGLTRVDWFINKGETMNTRQEIVLRKVGGNVLLTHEEVLNSAQPFEMPIYCYDKGGSNPKTANHPHVEKIGAIKIHASNISDGLRRRLTKKMHDANRTDTHLAIAVTVSVDRSARLFFEAKHGRAFMGRGQLRLDATRRSDGI